MSLNAALGEKPETMNQDPYGAGWVAKIKLSNLAADRAHLMDPAAYTDFTTA